MARRRSKNIRASEKLVKVIDDIKLKNGMKGTEAGDFLADFFISKKNKNKIIENIKREIVF